METIIILASLAGIFWIGYLSGRTKKTYFKGIVRGKYRTHNGWTGKSDHFVTMEYKDTDSNFKPIWKSVTVKVSEEVYSEVKIEGIFYARL